MKMTKHVVDDGRQAVDEPWEVDSLVSRWSMTKVVRGASPKVRMMWQ